MRKEIIVNLTDDGNELTFKIKQMSAIKQERWINKVLILAAGSNVLSGMFSSFKLSGLSNQLKNMNIDKFLDMFGKLDYEKIEPLYNELLECCSYVPDKSNLNFTTALNANNADSIIGDVQTLYKLRLEALKINFGFFSNGVKSPNQKNADIVITKRM